MKRFLLIFSFLWCVCLSALSQAAGYAGLTYETYQGTGASPSINPLTYPTVRSTGITSNINFPAGSFGNNILGSGLIDRVIVKWTGYINIPTSGVAYFGGNADDGLIIKVANTMVVNSWIDSGGAFREGNVTLTAGVHPIEVWYYENGGGQMVNLQYWTGTAWAIVPSTMLATDSTYWAPQPATLCCGGSSATFNVNAVHQSKINTFVNRTTADGQVHIEQIGNSNTITVQQTGTNNNYAEYNGNGSYNTVNITQNGTANTQVNYAEVNVTGNSNTVNVTQNSTAGGKGAFVTVNDNNNNVTLLQKDNGSHYASVNVSGGNKTVDITQQGSASHMANVTLSGLQTGLSLTQSGSTQQFYSINHTCSTSGGCGTITVQQGQ